MKYKNLYFLKKNVYYMIGSSSALTDYKNCNKCNKIFIINEDIYVRTHIVREIYNINLFHYECIMEGYLDINVKFVPYKYELKLELELINLLEKSILRPVEENYIIFLKKKN